MKKFAIYLAAAVALTGAVSCSQDTDPKYQVPTQFVLNTPALTDQYYELTAGKTFELTCTQPDYGYAAITHYNVDVCLDDKFEENTFETLEPTNPTLAVMTFKDADLAVALCALNGITTEEQKDAYNAAPAQKVYFRANAWLEGVETSAIASNVVSINNVKGYFAVPMPSYIYLVGSPEGWAGPTESNAAHYAPWRIFEPQTAIGSKVFTGVFQIPGSPLFRFYTKLTGWDADSYGSQVDDSPIEFELENDAFEGELVKGKGSFSFPSFSGGEMTITVDMASKINTVLVQAGAHETVVSQYLYMVGNNGGWVEPKEGTYEDWKLADSTGDGVYSATFDLAGLKSDDNALYCRFYGQLTGWGPAAYAAAEQDGDNVTVSDGVACPTMAGSGCFVYPDAVGKTIEVVLNTNTNTVTFTAK